MMLFYNGTPYIRPHTHIQRFLRQAEAPLRPLPMLLLHLPIIKNKKYTATKKNGGKVPPVLDKRVMYLPAPCGECFECRAKKKRDWLIRLNEEVKHQRITGGTGKFLTLTFSDKAIEDLINGIDLQGRQTKEKLTETGYELDNAIATRAVKFFLERWRRKYKKSLRHWFITELGHKGTERIHLHGFVWSDLKIDIAQEVENIWQYGHVWKGKQSNNGLINYVNEKTINYTVKYVHKIDHDHRYYKSKILCSPGIGHNYINTVKADDNKYLKEKTKDYYITSKGQKIKLPTYYRNKLYSEEEKENLWLQLLDRNVRYVGGKEIDIRNGEDNYYKALRYYHPYQFLPHCQPQQLLQTYQTQQGKERLEQFSFYFLL